MLEIEKKVLESYSKVPYSTYIFNPWYFGMIVDSGKPGSMQQGDMSIGKSNVFPAQIPKLYL